MSDETQTKSEVLDYISSLLRELRQIAHVHDQHMLAYLIDMAQLEAAEQLAASRDTSRAVRKQRDSAA